MDIRVGLFAVHAYFRQGKRALSRNGGRELVSMAPTQTTSEQDTKL